MNMIKWNTRRGYQSDGQHMAAAMLADGRVIFVDVSRGCEGVLRHNLGVLGYTLPEDADIIKDLVIHDYDLGKYDWLPTGFDRRDVQKQIDKLAASYKGSGVIGPGGRIL